MPDILSLLTREEAYEAINDSTAAKSVSLPSRDPEFVGIWVPAVSHRVDALCGPVVARDVVERHSGGTSRIELRQSPVMSVVSIEADGVTVEEEEYELDDEMKRRPFVYRLNGAWPAGRRNVTVTYQAGRYADTENVGPLFKLAASAILRRLWNRESSAWSTGGDPFAADAGGGGRFYKTIDPMVSEFLSDEMRPPLVA